MTIGRMGISHQLKLDRDIKTQIRIIPSNGITEINGVLLREEFPHGDYFLASTDFYRPETEAVVVARAKKHLKDNRFNMVIIYPVCKGNPVLAITPEGGVVPLDTEPDVVTSFMEIRALSTRFVSVLDDKLTSANHISEHYKRVDPAFTMYGVTLDLAHSLNLLPDSSGYVSANMQDGQALMSPRKVNKATTTLDDAIITKLDGTNVLYNDENKPSTDSGMCLKIYKSYPKMHSILHFHNEWGQFAIFGDRPYPCGTVPEADVALQGLDYGGPTNAFTLINHGAMFCFDGLTEISRLKHEYEEAVAEFDEHIEEIKSKVGELPFELLKENYKPIFNRKWVIGIIYDDGTYVVPYILPKCRGLGVGSHIIRQIKERYRKVATTDECGVVDYYLERGFNIVRTSGKLLELEYTR